jgi:hypothetical protein
MAYPLAERKATGAHSEIDNLIGMNDLKEWWNSVKGKNILGQETASPTQEDLLMMIMPMAGSIRGGKAAKPIIDQLLGLSNKLGIKQSFSKHLPKKVQDYVFQNKLNAARLQKQKILDKLEMEDPDKIFRGFSKN